MNHESTGRMAALPVCAALAAALLFMATGAFAQTNTAKPDEAKAVATPVATPTAKVATAPADQPVRNQAAETQRAESEEFDPPPLLLGDATHNLLAWQRSGEIASPTPRPIAGSVASRSYERYVKSFEHAIPEHLRSTVTKSNGGASGSSSGPR
jgi:hypothetical protein